MVALFIRDNLEEVIGDEEGEEKETNFNPDERGQPDGNPHQEIDLPDNFFLATGRNTLGLSIISYIKLIDFGFAKPGFKSGGTFGEAKTGQEKEGGRWDDGQDDANQSDTEADKATCQKEQSIHLFPPLKTSGSIVSDFPKIRNDN